LGKSDDYDTDDDDDLDHSFVFSLSSIVSDSQCRPISMRNRRSLGSGTTARYTRRCTLTAEITPRIHYTLLW